MNEKECKYCKRIIPAIAKTCPHCLKKQGLSPRMIILIVVLFLVMLVLFFAALAVIMKFSEKRLKPLPRSGISSMSCVVLIKPGNLADHPNMIIAFGKNHFMGLDNLIATQGATKIRLTEKPENLVFGE